MANNLGWEDPAWGQLYSGNASYDAPPAPPAPAGPPTVSYLDLIQSAAAADQEFDLADLPDFRTNLQAPRG